MGFSALGFGQEGRAALPAMGTVILFTGAIIAGVFAEGAPVAVPPAAELPKPVYTRQTLFGIPFRIQGPLPARGSVSVLLYVSTNRGRTWELTSQTEPDKGRFLFRAGNEGEFWFLIRTAARGIQTQTPAGQRPGLRVIVDTTPPKLDLGAQRADSGRLVARWKISEAHLNPESLKIQYRLTAEDPWQTVAIDRPPDASAGPEYVGETAWWQPGELQRVEIRAEVSDLAGNTTVSHAQVGASPDAGHAEPALAGDSSAVPRPPVPPRESGPPVLNAPGGSVTSRLPSSAWHAVRHSLIRSEEETPALPPSPSPLAAQVASPRVFTSPIAAESGSDGPRCQIVNALTFALDYDLGPAPAGDEQADFWGTQDGGRTWLSYGTDPDRRSPMSVTVKEEGVYGFRIVVRRAGALRSQPPPRGALPDLWVVVRAAAPAEDRASASSARILDAHSALPARPGQAAGL